MRKIDLRANTMAFALVSAALGVAPAASATEHGGQIYQETCIACHGADGKGVVPGTPDFTRKDGSLSKPDDVLVKHITEGFQSPGSPMAMPPRGGNPDLSDDDVRAVLKYLRANFGS